MTTSAPTEPFVWDGEEVGTIRELLDGASKAERDGKAAEFLTAYREVNGYADENLGYVIGYMEPAERRRQMYAAYDLTHPMLGGRP